MRRDAIEDRGVSVVEGAWHVGQGVTDVTTGAEDAEAVEAELGPAEPVVFRSDHGRHEGGGRMRDLHALGVGSDLFEDVRLDRWAETRKATLCLESVMNIELDISVHS